MKSRRTQEWRQQRLIAFAEREGGKAAAGRRIGYKDGAFIGQMLRGDRPITEKTVQAIEALAGYSGWFAADDEKPSSIIALHQEDTLPDGFVSVPEYTVRFSGGNGQTVISYELEESVEPATYRMSWLQQERLNPKHLKRFKVTGDSMEPLLYPGDTVLVNTAENELEQILDGRVYAIRYWDDLRVKQLIYQRTSGILTLRSINLGYKDEEVPPDQVAEHITIIGRVRDKSGSGGL